MCLSKFLIVLWVMLPVAAIPAWGADIPRAICLVDPDRRTHLYEDIAEMVSGWDPDCGVFCAENPGDKFVYGDQ